MTSTLQTFASCPCLDYCSRTLDFPFTPVCSTFFGATPPTNQTLCSSYGFFSPIRNSWLDYCTVLSVSSTAGYGQGGVLPALLTDFPSMWLLMFFSTVVGVVGVYVLVGSYFVCRLAGRGKLSRAGVLSVALRAPPALLTLGLAGFCHAMAPGALFAATVALMYLSIPYAIGSDVAIVLGFTMAAVVLFFAFNRDQPRHKPLHASEYAE